MSASELGIALIAYLTGAVAIYAYKNKNRHIDLAIAAVAVLTFGTAMLLSATGQLFAVAHFLTILSSALMVFAVLFLIGRLLSGASSSIARYFRWGKSNKR